MTDAKEILLSQLETHGAGVSTKDANKKFLRSLPSSWSQVPLIMRTKPRVDTLSFDDLYNNLRVFGSDVKGSTGSSSSTQNVEFVSFDNTSGTNEVNTAYGVSTSFSHNSQREGSSSFTDELVYSFFANQSSGLKLDHEDLEHLDEFDLEEMDLKWQVAMISMRLEKFYKKTRRKLHFDAKEPVGFDKKKVECFNCHNTGHFARECRSKGNQESIDWIGHAEDDTEDYALMAFNSSNSGSDTEVTSCSKECENTYAKLKNLYDEQREKIVADSIEIQAYTLPLKSDIEDSPVNDKFAKVEGMHAVSSSMTGIYMPPKFDFRIDESKFTYGPKQSKNGESDAKTSDLAFCDSNSSAETLESVPKPDESKPKADNPHQTLKGKGIVDSRCSRHMTGNKAYLVEYQDFNGGPVAFGGSKGQITDTECLVLSPNFKLPDENQVLLRVPRQHNMYCFNLEHIIPSGGLACLIAKATVDEFNKWHRRLGHVHFKNLNKLIKGNLVRGLPFKIFQNDHTCVACHKGKQHKASWIKREYSNSKTPQQNGVAKRKNMTLIEAARTMLADSFLPNTFWAKAPVTVENKANKTAGPKEANNSARAARASSPNFVKITSTTVNTASTPVNTASTPVNTASLSRNISAAGPSYPDLLNYANQDDSQIPSLEEGAIDVKSAFLYGKTDEEVYVSQPPGFIDPKFPKKVYKVVKALYGLHKLPKLVYMDDIIFGSTKKSWCDEFEVLIKNRFQMSSMGELTFFLSLQVKQKEDGIFISQDKYVAEILKKFDFMSVKAASTIETKKPLVKDAEAIDVDVHFYKSMIGSLMYLTASRPDIMYTVCTCSRFQVAPKTSHLQAVKRIFRYLKGQLKLGLWYPRESAFNLEAYSDSDYAGENLVRKSTTGGCQFLGMRLITWQCKKQTIVAIPTTEAEYVAAANCCGQVLWIQNQILDYGFNFINTKIYINNESTICEGADYAMNKGRSTDKIKVLNAKAGVSVVGETLSTAALAVSTVSYLDLSRLAITLKTEVLMMDWLSIVKIHKVIHSVEIDIVKLVVEIESFGMSSDEFDKETRLSDGLQPKKADLSCIHEINELHLHEIHVVLSKHEADQY
nr:uncharacterized mitochondrial protein AtMg00810-like [Tanacetum cinerariifolium]